MMGFDPKLDQLSPAVAERVAEFFSALTERLSDPPKAAYLIGAAARGEFSDANPDIQVLLVFERVDGNLLEKIGEMGNKLGKKGIRAPVILTCEYIDNASDVFPLEFEDLLANHVHLSGDDLLVGIRVSPKDLRVQVERELRAWRLRLRQAYVSAAGDKGWMSGWFADASEAVFPVFRGILRLFGEDPNAGNGESAARLTKAMDIDLSAFVAVWEMRKQGKSPEKDQVRALFDQWDAAFEALIVRVDGLKL